jgi:hypothetical protein
MGATMEATLVLEALNRRADSKSVTGVLAGAVSMG